MSSSSLTAESETTSVPAPLVSSPQVSRFAKIYLWTVVAAGAVVCLVTIYRLFWDDSSTQEVTWQLLLMVVLTITVGHRLIVKVPQGNGEITVVDTFIFLTMLLYDGEVAILLAAAEGLYSRSRFNRKAITILFSGAVFACSTFLTVWTLRALFGQLVYLPIDNYSAVFVTALCVMALVQFLVNTGLVAVGIGLKNKQSIWETWRKYCMWSSVTYFAGASAAGITARLINVVGFYAVVVTVPIIAIIYFTYKTYLKSVESATSQAEQAKRHVEELNHYIAEQERIREQFSQIEKLSALGELASGVAHSFNNNLAIILGRAQLTLKRVRDAEVARALQIIIEAAEDGSKTVKRIQDFAQQRRNRDFTPVAVDQLLFDVGEITRPRWKDHAQAKNVHIKLALENHSQAVVMGDASELREVLVNMVFNAVDAMPRGGRLTLAAEETDDGAVVTLAVTDTGTGMNPEVRLRVFDPFFTTKGEAGMGLGLAVSYGIIRRHEGTIEVDSEVNRGTTFRIKLPKLQTRVGALAGSEVGASVVPFSRTQQNQVLVVDDEVEVRELLREILMSEGYEVVVAKDGTEALGLFERRRFDAVFTDIGMPGMSGWELARIIRERNATLPLAIITGWGEVVSLSDQERVEVDYVVAKPFNVSRIAEIAREIAQRLSDINGAAA